MSTVKSFISKYHKDIIANLIFLVTFLFIYLFLTKNTYLFASELDFKYQHFAIPEYFRTLFYSTHSLFPDFAFNLGSGQNIYYLSYYGLFSPYILLSYLFPHINMLYFLITTNSLIVLISTSLFYFFLRKNNFNEKTSFITAFLFLLSGPLIFHAKRHYMFINYFPFLILGLFGIDRYFKTNKSTLLTISIILIIMTSYYFSIPSLIVLFLYYTYKYLNIHPKFNFQDFFSQTLKLVPSVLSALLITLPLTLPTLYTLFNGREASNSLLTLKELFTPSLTSNFFYQPYTIGLTLVSLISLVYFTLKGKKPHKFLSITLLIIITFPIFNYILNGTLYLNAKALIPFSPLILLLTATFLSKHLKSNLNLKQVLILSYLIITSLSLCLYTNSKDKLITKDYLTDPKYTTISKYINQITKEDNSFYRINTYTNEINNINKITNIHEYTTTIYSSTSNPYYLDTYNHILNNPLPTRNKFILSSSPNPLSQNYLNEKYIITTNSFPSLTLLKEENDVKLYLNNNYLPLGYATNQIINTFDYQTLDYPYNLIATNNYLIIDKPKNTTPSSSPLSNLETTTLNNYEITNTNNLDITKQDDYTIINAQNNASLTINLNDNLDNKLIFLKLDLKDNPTKDQVISINEEKNTLTAHNWKYYNQNTTMHFYLENTNTLNITFKKGIYQIKDFQIYTINKTSLNNLKNNLDEFLVDTIKTKGDHITGSINVSKDNAYFTISIPYDQGFKIKVDQQPTPYQKSGTNFITFPISKGSHEIEITYEAPYKKLSLTISILTLSFIIIKFIFKKIHRHK